MTTPPPSPQVLDLQCERGPHKSARDAIQFVREEMADFHRKGFWVVLPLKVVKKFPGLRLSPLGAVPQRNRRPRLINDLSFHGINADTVKDAPMESMQFGKTLERIMSQVYHANPRYGPVFANKIDLSVGFYRIGVANPRCAGVPIAEAAK